MHTKEGCEAFWQSCGQGGRVGVLAVEAMKRPALHQPL